MRSSSGPRIARHLTHTHDGRRGTRKRSLDLRAAARHPLGKACLRGDTILRGYLLVATRTDHPSSPSDTFPISRLGASKMARSPELRPPPASVEKTAAPHPSFYACRRRNSRKAASRRARNRPPSRNCRRHTEVKGEGIGSGQDIRGERLLRRYLATPGDWTPWTRRLRRQSHQSRELQAPRVGNEGIRSLWKPSHSSRYR